MCCNRGMRLDELRSLIAEHARPDGTTAIDGVFLFRSGTAGSPAPSMCGTRLTIVAQGARRLLVGDEEHECRAGRYIGTSVDLPVVDGLTGDGPGRPGLAFGLELRPCDTADLMRRAGRDYTSRTGEAPPAITMGDASGELIDAAVRLLRLLARPRDRAVLVPTVRQEILWYAVKDDQAGTIRQLGLAGSPLNRIARAARRIRDDGARPVQDEELARLAGMTVPAFHRRFLAVTGMTVAEFTRGCRRRG